MENQEMEILNVNDLDVEELERRIELASALPLSSDRDPTEDVCNTNDCGVNYA